ncbi:hypothetical protein BDW74DRAFT_151548, partial [Aspergillus multicolor]|uniref:uncharacterized protein n=1 Tax=Aspergillus multicolor TaxID=41759 RepID=UPI003CCE01DD
MIKSSAYQRLLERLQEQMVLETELCSVRESNRSTVVDHLLESPRISTSTASTSHIVLFDIGWELLPFIRERHHQSKSEIVERALTLTGSFTNAQALPCGEYMRQTWPLTAEDILSLMKQAI